MLTGPLIHNGVLEEIYRAHPAFWRPELNQDPPDMAALLPHRIAIGLIASLIQAAVYDNIRAALSGSGMAQGVKFGVIAFLFNLCASAGWSGVFNLPETIWVWWNVEALAVFVVGGAVLGWVVAGLSPSQ